MKTFILPTLKIPAIRVPSIGVKIDRRDSEILVAEADAKKSVERIERARRKMIRYLDYHYQRIDAIEEVLTVPAPGEQWEIMTQKGFNAFTIILWLIRKCEILDYLDLVTFNINEQAIEAVMALLDAGTIGSLRLVVSDSVKFRMPKRVEQLRREHDKRSGNGNLQLCFLWNHSKICLARAGENFFVVRGSGNLSNNAEIEQYTITNHKEMFEFYESTFDDALFGTKRGARHEILGQI